MMYNTTKRTRKQRQKNNQQLNSINALMGTLKPHSNGPLYRNTVIGTLAVDGWAVTFRTARTGLGGWGPAQSPPRCTKCNSPPSTKSVVFVFYTGQRAVKLSGAEAADWAQCASPD